jgi:murein hydrolase activator
MTRRVHNRVPFAVVGLAGLVGLAIAPPPLADGQGSWPPVAQQGASLERQMAEALREVEEAKGRKGRRAAEVEALDARRQAVEVRMGERARALYRVTRAGMLPLAGGVDAMLEHMGRIQRLEKLVREDVHAVRKLQARVQALRDELQQIETHVETMQAQYQALGQQAAVGASPAQPASPGGMGIRVLDGPPSGFDTDFAALRGRLELPVAGDFRAQETDVGEGPALLFATAPGAPVRAAAEGRVAFGDQHGDYGTLVIVDHGDSYYTVYGGLARVSVRVGDYVGARARLGTVANDGLIFEVRHRTRSLPPRPWLGF